ncbi:MAG: gas vesicle protein GvpG [Anaerolineae bacterium CG_4_9_14_0_8_um_filter_58_9]|nr:MAG: gas vesicle protein GvpG [Anaerolineae bacterium CG_4_9_14_0_8_um_filter_58_9]
MGLLLKLLTLPVSGPIEGVVWIAKKVAEQADKELYDAEKVQGQLMELELRYDLEEISEEEYLATEQVLLERLRISRERQAAESEK